MNTNNIQKRKFDFYNFIEILLNIIKLGLIGIILFNIFYIIVRIDGISMNPTFQDNQKLVILKYFKKNNIKRGSIVIAKCPIDRNKQIIKRVIALPGDKLQIKEHEVYVNDKKIEEPYIKEEMNALIDTEYSEGFYIPKDHVFLMGDNRNCSMDSRQIGPFSINSIVALVQK